MAFHHVIAFVLLMGCAGHPLKRDPHEGQYQLAFHNEAGSAICAVHIFPHGEQNEGSNWLVSGSDGRTDVVSGSKVAFWVQPGTYQVRVTGCARERLQASGYAPQVIMMNGPGLVVLFREDDPRSVQAAGELAHENENATQMPAKLTVNKSVPEPARSR